MSRLILVALFSFFSFLASSQYSSKGFNLDNLTFLDSTITDYDLFLTAEWHWRSENTGRMKKMIEYLASNNSLNAIIVERSYDFGHWVNYFLETGDSLFLKEFLEIDNFFSVYHGVLLQDEYEFYCWLRRFKIQHNLSIRVIGIDLHAYWDEKPILWSFLKLVDQNPSLQKPLKENVDLAVKLFSMKNVSIHTMLKWNRHLQSSALEMKISDTVFLNFLFSLNQSVKYAHGGKFNYREKQIAVNFLRYIEKGEKVFGQFGLGHNMLQPEYSERTIPFNFFMKPYRYNSFTYLLNQNDYYKGKILSIGRICFDCKDIGPEYGKDISAPYVSDEAFIKLKPQFENLPDNTIIDLRGTKEKITENSQLLLLEFD
ncbi:hypothetical protein G3O08_09825 [Cryomorpha ignava]|uniref:Erythromycin esterase family protein n=1 Tax=Cryomorpha ignava TaxID=101383 RepID=A0A7K3WQ53_9FLAO|nr:hypothetical protein [Cryomorpha ignava]NEN23799.1 hypothetical protein [Cryomorpha ignava]